MGTAHVEILFDPIIPEQRARLLPNSLDAKLHWRALGILSGHRLSSEHVSMQLRGKNDSREHATRRAT